MEKYISNITQDIVFAFQWDGNDFNEIHDFILDPREFALKYDIVEED